VRLVIERKEIAMGMAVRAKTRKKVIPAPMRLQVFLKESIELPKSVASVSIKQVMYWKGQGLDSILLHGLNVRLDTQTLTTFRNSGVHCMICGIKGIVFNLYHFLDNRGRETGDGYLVLHAPNPRYGGFPNLKMGTDHIVPRCMGGSDHIDNLQTCCCQCNGTKGGDLDGAIKALIKMRLERKELLRG
jgi:5-methylcytosine-specific restriction endonuclease McrA